MASNDSFDSKSLVSSKVVKSPPTQNKDTIQINNSHINNNNDAQQPNKNNTQTNTSHNSNIEQRLTRKRKRYIAKSVEKGSNISDLELHEADVVDDNDENSSAIASDNEGYLSSCSITSEGSLKKKKVHTLISSMYIDHKDIQIDDSGQNNSDDEAEANETNEISDSAAESKEELQLDDQNNSLAGENDQDNPSDLDKPVIDTNTEEEASQNKLHLLISRQDDNDNGADEATERTTMKYLGHLSETDKQSEENSNFSYRELSTAANPAASSLNCISSQVEEAFNVLQHQYMAPEQALVTNVELVMPPTNNFATYDSCRPQSTCTTSSDSKTTIPPANLDLEEIKQQTCDTALRNEHISVPVGINESNIPSGSIWTPHSGYKHLFVPVEQDIARTSPLQSPRNQLEQKILQNTPPPAQATKNYAQLFGTENFRLHQQQEMLQNFKREGLHRYPQMLHMPHYSPHHDHQNRQQQHQLQTQSSELYTQVNPQYGNYVQTHPHQHYAHDPLFGMHHAQEQQSHQHQHIGQGHIHLDQSANMQPQQQRQQHTQHMPEAYQDLLIDEFQENPNATYKLGLSPSNVKPENQDDGYETCAGDVLTPNSHSSSTHSVTPQHQMQHGLIGVTNSNNNLDQQQPSLLLNTKPTTTTAAHSHVMQLNENQMNESVNCGISNERAENIGSSSYNFIDDEIHIMSPGPQSSGVPPNSSVYISSLENGQNHSNSHVFAMKHQQLQQQLIVSDSLVGIQQQHQMSMPPTTPGDDAIIVQDAEHQKHQVHNTATDLDTKPPPKRRGRKKKVNDTSYTSSNIAGLGEMNSITEMNGETNASMSVPGILKTKERKKHDRFNGMSEDEVVKRTIPDHLCENLDIVIVGINPSLFAAYKGHHYAGPGNHFWKCIYLSGLSQEQMSADEDYKLLKQGIGFTNMVSRATKGSADLTRKEIKEGSRILLEKLQQFRPKIAVFNGKLIFEVFSGKKDFNFGRQPECVEGTDTYIWVMPSSSARCAQLPRAADKVPFYVALKKFRDYLNGLISHIDESECVFTEQRIKMCCEQVAATEQTHSESVCNSTINYLYDDNGKLKPQDKMLVDAHYGRNPENTAGSGYVSAYDATENMHMVGHPHGHLGRPSMINECYSLGSPQFGQQLSNSKQIQEKKKRGRPKKIRGQELTDGSSLNKIVLPNAQQQHHDFNNILNLSVVGAVNAGSDEVPKKKRGRPKKQKGIPSQPMQKSLPIQQQSNLVSLHTLRMEHAASPQQQQQQQQLQSHQSQSQNQSLYNTPPPSHTILYNSSASPMPSPAINCTYTPPVSVQVTPPQTASVQSLNSSPTEHIVTSHLVPDIIRESHLGETPPPNSPNICSVDFETANNNSAHNSHQEQQKSDHQQQMNAQRQHHRMNSESRYASPVNEITNENDYPLWKQQVQSQSPVTHFGAHSQQQHLKYQEAATQQWQRQNEQNQQQQQQQEQQQHHRYEDLDNQYLLSPQQDSTARPDKQQQSHLASSDVARKSLSGLESLVEQIPSISESESNAMSAAAAAAAVERRLLGLEQQQHSAVQDGQEAEHFVVANASNSINNSSFSVSNLAASATTPTAANNDAIGCHLTAIHPAQNAEYGHSEPVDLPSPGAYHHSNIISAALAAAAAQSPTPASTTAHHVTTHPQMYMDPTHMPHMAHVPVNSMYGPPAGTPHHPHPHSHVNHFSSAYGQSMPEHNTGVTSDYGAYSQSPATLHMPSPNYPYAHYGHAPAQSNYVGVGYAHTHTHPHAHTHHPLPHHGHTAHHLSVFERLKPSDIGSYSGF